MKRRGFTLIELLVVLAIIGILLSMAVPMIPIQTIRYDQCCVDFYHKMLELRELTYRTNCQYRIRFSSPQEIAIPNSASRYKGFSYVTVQELDRGNPYPKWRSVETLRFPDHLYLRYNIYNSTHTVIRFDRNLTLGDPCTLTFFADNGGYARKLTVDVWTNRIYLYKKEG